MRASFPQSRVGPAPMQGHVGGTGPMNPIQGMQSGPNQGQYPVYGGQQQHTRPVQGPQGGQPSQHQMLQRMQHNAALAQQQANATVQPSIGIPGMSNGLGNGVMNVEGNMVPMGGPGMGMGPMSMGGMSSGGMGSLGGMGGVPVPGMVPGLLPGGPSVSSTVNVWKYNLNEQMAVLRDLVEKYKYVAIDCKFPGIVARPIGTFKSTSEYHYQTLRSNVDILQVIQIGISLADEFGNPPATTSTSAWQFNFAFDVQHDMCSADGVELLRQSGIDLDKHASDGIDPFVFGEVLISSGLVLDDSVSWITFHSGYDLGYLLSIMLNKEVPVEEREFLKCLRTYFPVVWDVKYMNNSLKLSSKTQLADIAEDFHIRRPPSLGGPPSGSQSSGMVYQAGSDALVTLGCFLEVKRIVGDSNIAKVKNLLFGLSEGLEDDAALAGSATATPHPGSGSGLAGPSSSAANLFQYGKMGGSIA